MPCREGRIGIPGGAFCGMIRAEVAIETVGGLGAGSQRAKGRRAVDFGGILD